MFAKKSIPVFAVLLVFAASLVTTSQAKAGSLPCGGSVTVMAGDTLRAIASRCSTTVAALQLANSLNNPNLIYPGQVLLMPGAVLKGNGVADIYIVMRGDTLKSIAVLFNTTMDKLLSLNPGIFNPNLIFEGQRLNIPVNGSPATPPPPTGGQVYIVQRGDTMKLIAARLGISLDTLVKANPQVANINLIYVGQSLNVPSGIASYIVVRGDSLRIIAARFGTTLDALLKLNPSIQNPNIIYVGQIIKIR